MQKFKPVAQNTEILNVSVQYEAFGKYVLLEKLATGGMAEVFLARGSGAGGIGKFFAVKRILPQYADSPEFIDMFKDEAKIAINLSHSNIVSIHEFGVEKGQFFLVMDYVEGRNLRQILNKMKKTGLQFSFDQIVYVIKEVAAGLDHAHRCLDGSTGKPLNITHRDMSPQNVMVSFEGEVKIVDFGIAKAESQIETTRAGTLKGKFGYMSPEQAEGQPVDLRTDIFSLGIVLWELLANDRLFVANNEINTLRKIRDCQIPSLRKINPNIQAELERIVQKALARDRNLRYQTGAALHRDLSRFLNRQYPDFSPHDFSVFIKSVFADEILSLRKRLVEYTKLNVAAQPTNRTSTRNEIAQTSDSISLSNSGQLQTGSQSAASSLPSLSAVTAPSTTAPNPHLGADDSASNSMLDKTEISGSAISVPDMTSPSREMTVTQEPTENLHLKSSPTAVTMVPENVREGTRVSPGPSSAQQQPPAVAPPAVNGKKPLAPTLLLDEAALAKEAQKNYENVAREGLKSSPSITGIGGNLETEEVTSPSIVNRRPRSSNKYSSVNARHRRNRKGNSATFATFLVFILVCASAYVYLVKYFTTTMEPVIAKTDPVLGPIHDLLGVPRRTTTSSLGSPITKPLTAAEPVAPSPAQLPEPGTAAFSSGPTPLPMPEPAAAEASVAVTSNPSGAEIIINNQPTGLSTPNQINVPGQGTFSIIVRKRGYYDFKRTEITADAIGHRLDVSMQKMNVGFIDVEIFPPQDAILYVNGKIVPLYKGLARDITIPGNTPVKVRAESRKQNSYDETTVTIGSDHRKVIQLNPRKIQRQPSSSK